MNNNDGKIELEKLGYSDFFKNHCTVINDADLSLARIIAEHRELYVLRTETSELLAKITGKMMFEACSREDYPAVGDWVLIRCVGDEQAIITEILPRKTILKRKSAGNADIQIIASNIDQAFIVQAPDRDYSLNRFERYFALAESGGIKPSIVLSKTDLISDQELDIKLAAIKDRFKDINIYTTSSISGKGIDMMKKDIKPGVTYCFLGSSGVGKSTIINTLLGKELIKTKEISSYSNRGKHVTTHRQLFILKDSGLLIDNPGMREIGLLDSGEGIENVFSEIKKFSDNCRYSDCTHRHEPGCAVLTAVREGGISKQKYDNYVRLEAENEFNTLTKLERREKDRDFGKMIKDTKKQLKKFKPGK